MIAFYKTAMGVFLDNVPSPVIQEAIVNQVPQMFCPEFVFAMEADLVRKIIAESEAKVLQRQELTRKLRTLEAGYSVRAPGTCRLEGADRPSEFVSPLVSSKTRTPSPETVSSIRSGGEELSDEIEYVAPPHGNTAVEAMEDTTEQNIGDATESWENFSSGHVVSPGAFDGADSTIQVPELVTFNQPNGIKSKKAKRMESRAADIPAEAIGNEDFVI